MKKKHKLRLLIFSAIMLTVAGSSKGQTGNKSSLPARDTLMQYAYYLLNGTGVTIDPKEASSLFFDMAETGDAEAHNALGMMYKHGIRTDINDKKAYSFFQKAAALGYAKAYYNLGLMYRFGHYVTQDLDSASLFFSKAKDAGYNDIDYIIGYSQFKGMGETQSYTEAFLSFEQGALKGSSASMYMLALCYLHGRGVSQDIELGKYWMEQAINRAYSPALDFICTHESESFVMQNSLLKTSQILQPIDKLIPVKYTRLKNTINDDFIAGLWEGKIITYDWSGEEIETETRLQLSLNICDDMLEGVWTESDTVFAAISARFDSTGWVFDNVIIKSQEDDLPVELRLAKFARETVEEEDYLHGNVSLYCDATREYSAPKYIYLKRVDANTSTPKTEIKTPFSVYPNPFNDEIRIDFNLHESREFSFTLCDIQGKQVYTSDLKIYPAGVNRLYIPALHIPNGIYVLKITGSSTIQTIKIIK